MSLLSGLVLGLGAGFPVTISGLGLGRTEGGSSWQPVALPAAGAGILYIASSASDMGSLRLAGSTQLPCVMRVLLRARNSALLIEGLGFRGTNWSCLNTTYALSVSTASVHILPMHPLTHTQTHFTQGCAPVCLTCYISYSSPTTPGLMPKKSSFFLSYTSFRSWLKYHLSHK